MPVLRLFAAAREAAGVARVELDGATVADLLAAARQRYGDRFSAVVDQSRVWVNGEPASGETVVRGEDVVAVLPPVSGGAGDPVLDSPPPVRQRAGAAPPTLRRPRAPRPAPGAPATTLAPERTGVPEQRRPPEREPDVPDASRRSTLARLAVVYDSTRPHGRIGLAWAIVTVAVVIAGPWWVAAWFGVAALAAASQTARARRTVDQQPPTGLAAAVAVALPVAAVVGVRDMIGVAAACLGVAVACRALAPHRPLPGNVSQALVLGVVPGVTASAVVLTRVVGADAALFLLACACVYDTGAYLVGTGATAIWEGPCAGVVALIPVSILAAVILVPPFPSGTPLALGLVAALLAPLGPLAASWLLGSPGADAPGLRRLDSLIVLSPAWAWLVTTILR